MSFNYRNNARSISNIEQYPDDDELIVYGDSVKNSFGYTIEKVYLNFTGMPMVVCRRDGVNVIVPTEECNISSISPEHRNKFLILTYHRFGRRMSGDKCFSNRYTLLPEANNKRIRRYMEDLDKLTFTENLFNSYAPKETNVIKQNTVISLDDINTCEGGFYCFDEDITIARQDMPELHVHPFQSENSISITSDSSITETSIELRLNDCERKFSDKVYYMVGNVPCRIATSRDCMLENGLFITYKDAISKKITKHHYPIEEIIDGSKADNLDFNKPIVYRSRHDAINYGKGEDIVKSTTLRLKTDLETAKTEAQRQKLEFDERNKLLQIEQDKLDEEKNRYDRELKLKQEEFDQKVRLEEMRLKSIREETVAREKHQSEQWKGMLAIASGIFGILMIVLKR